VTLASLLVLASVLQRLEALWLCKTFAALSGPGCITVSIRAAKTEVTDERINFGRVIGGGLLAGLIINISEFILNGVLLAQQMEAAMRSLNRPPVDNQMIVWFVVLGLLFGIVTVWLYAAIRPRLGPGVERQSARRLTVWFLAYVYSDAAMGGHAALPRRLILVTTIWGLFEIVIAAVAGAWLYSEA